MSAHKCIGEDCQECIHIAPYQRMNLVQDGSGVVHLASEHDDTVSDCGVSGSVVVGQDWDIDCEKCDEVDHIRGTRF